MYNTIGESSSLSSNKLYSGAGLASRYVEPISLETVGGTFAPRSASPVPEKQPAARNYLPEVVAAIGCRLASLSRERAINDN